MVAATNRSFDVPSVSPRATSAGFLFSYFCCKTTSLQQCCSPSARGQREASRQAAAEGEVLMKYGKVTLGQIEAVWNRLGGEEGVRTFLMGKSEVAARMHIINCAAAPLRPSDFETIEHLNTEPLEWDPEHIYFRKQNARETILDVYKVRSPYSLNAAVLDYLLIHQQIIPEFWDKDRYIYFWGSIFKYNGDLYVRALRWNPVKYNRGEWESMIDRIDGSEWSSSHVSITSSP